MGSSSALNPERILNVHPNTFWNWVKKNTPQGSVFQHGQPHPPGFEGATPMWVNYDFANVAAFATQDETINLPHDFKLLGVVGFSYQVGAFATKLPFSVLLYDVNRQQWLTERGIRGDMALGAAPGFIVECREDPYAFQADNGQVFVRVTNLSAQQAYIAVALVGISGGENA